VSGLERTYARLTVTADAAAAIVTAGQDRARELDVSVSIAVVDESGILKAFSRMDGCPLPGVQLSQDKAYTAAGFAIATDAWYERLQEDPPFAIGGPAGVDRLIVFGGGHPLQVGDVVVGGVGVSGAHVSDDMEVARAALLAFDTVDS
jgi:uncharacterized protein GlcG (DUF336 family)